MAVYNPAIDGPDFTKLESEPEIAITEEQKKQLDHLEEALFTFDKHKRIVAIKGAELEVHKGCCSFSKRIEYTAVVNGFISSGFTHNKSVLSAIEWAKEFRHAPC